MKSEIKIVQTKERLAIAMEVAENYSILNIVLENPDTMELKKYPVVRKDGEFLFGLEHVQLVSDLIVDQNLKNEGFAEIVKNLDDTGLEKQEIPDAEAALEADVEKDRWFWYAETAVEEEFVTQSIIEKSLEGLEHEAERPHTQWRREHDLYIRSFRLGKFKNTKINGLEQISIIDRRLFTYINPHGYLVTVIDKDVKGDNKLQVEKMKTAKSSVRIEGRLNTGYFEMTNCHAILKSRKTISEIVIPCRITRNEEDFKKKYGKNIYLFSMDIKFDGLLEYAEDIYDLFLEAKMPYSETPVRLRVGRPTFRAKHLFKEVSGRSGNDILLINPYYTIYKSNLSFEVFPFQEKNYRYLKSSRRFSKLKQKLNRKKDVWIVGERPYKAQDTGFHFFKYMREQYPEKNVYYVISKDSPEYDNVAKLGNILEYGSKEHIKNILIATKIFSSHNSNYLFPIRTKSYDRKIRATRVFLQHGVMGVKNMANLYSAASKSFKTDLVITSSEYEKSYIISDFGYQEKDVAVTGLSRFDALFAQDVPLKRQMLIIPTWRDWIQNIESFIESEYFERYLNLVNNQELLNDAREKGYEILLCLHPNMQTFSSYFEDSPVKIIYQGDVDVQELIKESALMVTDYSSVAFDFSFLHKPVIYYQFDRNRFIGKRGSHIDLLNDLPGDIVEEEQELLQKILEYAQTNFEMTQHYKDKANKFIKNRDRNSSERIFQAAIGYEKSGGIIEGLKDNEILVDVFNKFRKSKYYFPTMKSLYSMMRTVLPIDDKKVFFESGIGKSFADSPKEIFEVLQQEERDMNYIWAYNRNPEKSYQNTKVVKRLSPQYYYHLATSKYWVNNQNFPTYIKKRKGTQYLQTWHGTPLKRMLHDVEEFQGRDETYLERVSEAVQRWDYLVSPSSYATESFKSAFLYDGAVLEEGYPRNDIFFRDGKEEKVIELRDKLNIDPSKKVILYAMTFRDNQSENGRFTYELPIDLQNFHERFGDEYVLLIRMHAVISKKLKIPAEVAETIKNVSAYPDIQELMLLSDILITDYSSVFFDFLNTDKPILFYTYDLEEYRDKLRGFYLDFEEEAPGPLCLEEASLLEAISNIEQVQSDFRGKYLQSKERFTYLDDGFAAKRIVDKVFS